MTEPRYFFTSSGCFWIASEIEQKIWEIWSTHPTDQKLTKMLAQGSALMNSRMFKEAIIIFDHIWDNDFAAIESAH